ncbi:endonuclease domain-containing protein [Geodermatophilus sp. SYSU D00703]
MPPSKLCPECKRTKPITDFGRNRSLGDGLSFYCLACNRVRNNRFYRQRREAAGHRVRDHSWIPDGFRWCPTCRQPVPHEDFTRNRRSPSGFGSQCKPCKSSSDSESYFFRKYGLTRRAMAELRASRSDRCAICGDPSPQHLDHDHESGVTRQLLCQRCNHGLGLFRDDPSLLHGAAFYVQEHREAQALRRLEGTFVVRPGGTDG